MEIQRNKKNKISKTISNNTLFDDDFASGFEDSKFNKFKPALKVLAVIVVLMSVVWGVSAYFGTTDTKNDTNKPSSSQTSNNSEPIKDTDSENIEPAQENAQDSLQPSNNTPQFQDSSNNNSNSTPTTNTYDSSKCEPLNSEAANLRQAADQKKATYDNAFAARKNYGYFYDKYGNSTAAQQAYDNQEAQLNSLQADWQDALNKGNSAYAKYQECRANL